MAEPGQDPTLQLPANVDAPPRDASQEGTTHVQDDIEAESQHTDDEGYQESSTSSLLSSIASEIAKGKSEHGRTYAVYGANGNYLQSCSFRAVQPVRQYHDAD